MLQLFLVLHVLGAIFVFGPTVAFTFLANENRRMPGHGAFARRPRARRPRSSRLAGGLPGAACS